MMPEDALNVRARAIALSVWQEGYPWMRMDVDEAVDNVYIKPTSEFRMNPEEENDYDRGLVYNKVPEILTCGHQVSQKRVAKIEEST